MERNVIESRAWEAFRNTRNQDGSNLHAACDAAVAAVLDASASPAGDNDKFCRHRWIPHNDADGEVCDWCGVAKPAVRPVAEPGGGMGNGKACACTEPPHTGKCPQAPGGGVVQEMIRCIDPLTRPELYSPFMLNGMTAAYRVARERVLAEALGPVTFDEFRSVQVAKGLPASTSSIEVDKCNDLLSARLARLSQPVVVDELQEATDWLDSESSANEGFSTPAIQTLRRLVSEAIAGRNEP